MRIERAWARTGGERPTTKTGRSRVVALPASLVDRLRAHRRERLEVGLACGVQLPDDAHVFTDEPDGSKPWRSDSTARRVRKAGEAAGVAGVTNRSLRHFVATELGERGVAPRVVADRLGHATPGTTLAVYTHTLTEADRRAADLLDSVIQA